MPWRSEYKYLVPNALLPRMRADVQPYMDIDPFAGKQSSNEYTVRSVYYDTPRFDCYDEKLDGLKCRRKYRIRGYNRPDEKSIVFLEIKKKYSSLIDKHRAPLLYKDVEAFLASRDIDKYIIPLSGNGQEKSDAQRFLYHYYRRALRPAVLVVYDREAFMGKFDPTLRVTFDKNLRGRSFPSLETLYDEVPLQYAMRTHFILEMKFIRGALPAWAITMIHQYGLPRMALSKYTICLDEQQAVPRVSIKGRACVAAWNAA